MNICTLVVHILPLHQHVITLSGERSITAVKCPPVSWHFRFSEQMGVKVSCKHHSAPVHADGPIGVSSIDSIHCFFVKWVQVWDFTRHGLYFCEKRINMNNRILTA
jgi:hypothetical protein